ncbi:MAG: thioredoxin fold domain-containing protein [Gammaproteobacteria bacterium]|jgi:thiol:disulfide interchange protein DsbC|nr:thioredoxin fold domain-containing protein [Gammaproteobacteria bacterium]
MKNKSLWYSFLMLLLVSGPALATFDQVEQRLEKLFGADGGWVIASTPIDGLVQVTVGTDVFFLTEDGQYLVEGRLVNLDTRDDLSELARRDIRVQLLEEVDTSTLISYGPADADYELLVFTDTDCGYCRRLHGLIEDYNELGIRVSYAAFPRAGLGSTTYTDLVSVWCSGRPERAMDQAQSGQSIQPQQCDDPVSAHYKLGQQMGIGGTPTMITPSGEMILGIVQPAELRDRLDQAAAGVGS